MNTAFPFLFVRLTPESQAAYKANLNTPLVIQDWIVKIAYYDMKIYDSTWMDDDELGNVCLIFDVDIVDDSGNHIFDNCQKARAFIKQWWIDHD